MGERPSSLPAPSLQLLIPLLLFIIIGSPYDYNGGHQTDDEPQNKKQREPTTSEVELAKRLLECDGEPPHKSQVEEQGLEVVTMRTELCLSAPTSPQIFSHPVNHGRSPRNHETWAMLGNTDNCLDHSPIQGLHLLPSA